MQFSCFLCTTLSFPFCCILVKSVQRNSAICWPHQFLSTQSLWHRYEQSEFFFLLNNQNIVKYWQMPSNSFISVFPFLLVKMWELDCWTTLISYLMKEPPSCVSTGDQTFAYTARGFHISFAYRHFGSFVEMRTRLFRHAHIAWTQSY